MTSPKRFLELIKACDNFPDDSLSQHSGTIDLVNSLYRLYLPNDEHPHGYIHPSVVVKVPWTDDFIINSNDGERSITIRAAPINATSDTHDAQPKPALLSKQVNQALQRQVDILVDGDYFPFLNGRHSEHFLIPGTRYHGSRVSVERFAAPIFGIVNRGAHMTVYTRRKPTISSSSTTPTTNREKYASDLAIWVPRRSKHVYTYPSMLDTTVAGGVKAEHSPFECIVQEADEEASLPEALVRRDAKAVGTVSYISRRDVQTGDDSEDKFTLVVPDVLYCYDMEVDQDTIPRPRDDEVEDFHLMVVPSVVEALCRDEFKDNCALVMIDFLMRHGVLTPENEPHYVEIAARLRRRLPFPTS